MQTLVSLGFMNGLCVSSPDRQDLFVILRDFSGLTQVLIPQEEVRTPQDKLLPRLTWI